MSSDWESYFDDTQKVAAFNRIAENYYNHNFGRMNKGDFDLLMFAVLMDRMIEEYTEDGALNYSMCSDYQLSNMLGITQARISNLKVRHKLVYGTSFEWEKSFTKLLDNARLENGKVIISIPDPNLFLEIQEFLERNGAYVETQLNHKLLKIRAEYFIDLIAATENEETRGKIIKEYKAVFKKTGKDDNAFDENHMGKSLISASANLISVLANISSIINPSNVLGSALINFIVKNAGNIKG